MHYTPDQLIAACDLGAIDAKYILIWPDGTWCHPDNRSEFAYLGDDYTPFFYQAEVYSDDELDIAAQLISNGCSTAFVHQTLISRRRTLLNFFRGTSCSSGA